MLGARSMVKLTTASSPSPKRPFRMYMLNSADPLAATKVGSDATSWCRVELTLARYLLAASTRRGFIWPPLCTTRVSS